MSGNETADSESLIAKDGLRQRKVDGASTATTDTPNERAQPEVAKDNVEFTWGKTASGQGQSQWLSARACACASARLTSA